MLIAFTTKLKKNNIKKSCLIHSVGHFVYFVCLISVSLFISVCFNCLPEMVNKDEYIDNLRARY